MAVGLPVGVAGEAELADVELRVRATVEDFAARVSATLPPELSVTGAWEVPLEAPSLTSQVVGARYRAVLSPVVGEALADPAAACAAFLARREFPVEGFRKGETITLDARPALTAFAPDGPGAIALTLRAGAGIRPREVVEAFLTPFLGEAALAALDGHLTVTRTALLLAPAGAPIAPAPA